jgi:hypothetical protein
MDSKRRTILPPMHGPEAIPMDARLPRRSTLRPALLILGSFTFSWCLAVAVHETGHAIACALAGAPNIRMHVHPFALSYVYYDGVLPLGTWAFTAYMGPLFDLLCATAVALLLWRKRNPYLLPLLMWSATAYMMEAVGILIGLGEGLPHDWAIVVHAGVSPIVVIAIAVVCLVIGSAIMLRLLPLANMSPEGAFPRKIGIALTGFLPFFLLSTLYAALFSREVLMARAIALASGVVLIVGLAAIYRPTYRFLDRFVHTGEAPVRWPAAWLSLGLGIAIVAVEMLVLNA